MSWNPLWSERTKLGYNKRRFCLQESHAASVIRVTVVFQRLPYLTLPVLSRLRRSAMERSIQPYRSEARFSRRRWLRGCGVGLLGLSLADYFGLRAARCREAENHRDGFGRAKACIVLYCWGGVSQLDTWDPKPDAPAEVRGEFKSIATTVAGVRFTEHLPRLARQMKRLAVVRSVHHTCTAHGKSMYWNRTGHAPPQPESAVNLPPSINDWPTLGAQVAKHRCAPRGMPAAVQLPYPLVDNSTLQAGDTPGWLGSAYAPVVLHPNCGKPYAGVSRDSGGLPVRLPADVDATRLHVRQHLSHRLERFAADSANARDLTRFQERAADLLSNPRMQHILDLDQEPDRIRRSYGDHLCGQSLLLSRRLVESGVPLVTVICSAGDLNGGSGDHWDTHSDNFPRLKNALLPPLDQGSSALLDDLADRGLLDSTLIVWLTEFGRTPRMTGTGRNHYPFCYSVVFAGGGIRGGQLYGRSDSQAARPVDFPCRPDDLQATILHALGIPLDSRLIDAQGRPLALSDGQPLPVFV
jgi:hypothetical protein